MKSYVIIDDEPIAHRIIEKYCENLTYLNKIGNCYNAFEAMKLLNEQCIDLIFLDINMPKLSGFDFLKTLQNPPKIIVTTAYKEFALEGYELNISDYLLKPFSLERFIKAINKTFENTHSSSISHSSLATTENENVFIKGDKKTHQVNINEILFIEAYGNYTKFYFENNMILSHEKISKLETILPQDKFLRVHKSFIVSISKIETIVGNRILMLDHKIPIGQTYKKQINNLLS
ncbi:DNA-binding response regulator [Aquaticitalea lipolytica]|uniref:DNA-binding response regulator n=1 Tax=Aquaticitalea lipolytica TaxID=1247562 RepID=A0A8J2TRY4_9FLAO|nr:response regulator transcription factor [Aquaticitalea lipolytica]GFZ93625.1 DNA-binding response regulator [Aquaticitalea lipolytica]